MKFIKLLLLLIILITNNQITHARDVKRFRKTHIDLSNKKIKGVNWIRFGKRVRSVNLANNRIKKARKIRFRKNIEWINLASNRFTDANRLRLEEGLRWLRLAKNNNLNIAGIFLPNSLEYLDLSDNIITDLDNITWNNNLSEIDLRGNPIFHLDNITWNNNLQTLHLDFTQLNNITNITFPNSLKYLSLAYTALPTSPVINLPPNLEYFGFGGGDKIDYDTLNINFNESLQVFNGAGARIHTRSLANLPDGLSHLSFWGPESYKADMLSYGFPKSLKKLQIQNANPYENDFSGVEFPYNLEYFNIFCEDIACTNIIPPEYLTMIANSDDYTPPANIEEMTSNESNNLPHTVKHLDMDRVSRDLSHITLPSRTEILNLKAIDIPVIDNTYFSSIQFPTKVKTVHIGSNRGRNKADKLHKSIDLGVLNLPDTVKELDLSSLGLRYHHIKNLRMPKGIEKLYLGGNNLRNNKKNKRRMKRLLRRWQTRYPDLTVYLNISAPTQEIRF